MTGVLSYTPEDCIKAATILVNDWIESGRQWPDLIITLSNGGYMASAHIAYAFGLIDKSKPIAIIPIAMTSYNGQSLKGIEERKRSISYGLFDKPKILEAIELARVPIFVDDLTDSGESIRLFLNEFSEVTKELLLCSMVNKKEQGISEWVQFYWEYKRRLTAAT
ncbi:MAG: hypothetical protein ACRDBG_28260 [Waterburya sp.]